MGHLASIFCKIARLGEFWPPKNVLRGDSLRFSLLTYPAAKSKLLFEIGSCEKTCCEGGNVADADKPTVTIRRNHNKGMYELSFHDQPGYSANWEPFNSEEQLREKLLALGVTEDHVNDTIDGLDKRDSARLSVAPAALKKERVIGRIGSLDGATYDCNCCSWKVSMEPDNITQAQQLFSEHFCADNPPLK